MLHKTEMEKETTEYANFVLKCVLLIFSVLHLWNHFVEALKNCFDH